MKINVEKYDKVAREVFAPIYPVIAEQIKNTTGITKGTCLDVGCGSGCLGRAIAEITNLNICFFDQSAEMLELAARYAMNEGIATRVHTLLGDVHTIPLPDQSVELVVSRGSIFFWENRPAAYKEIYRVLAPGGIAYIGGGFGTPELKRQIIEKMQARNKQAPDMEDFREKVARNLGQQNAEVFQQELQSAGIAAGEIIRDDAGLWIVMRRGNC